MKLAKRGRYPSNRIAGGPAPWTSHGDAPYAQSHAPVDAPALLSPDPPPPTSFDRLREAAVAADTGAPQATDLAGIWASVLSRRLNVRAVTETPRRVIVVFGDTPDPAAFGGPFRHIETAILVRVLCGEQQKLIAADLGIACSTASKWYTAALAKLHPTRMPVPLPLVIAAQAWASRKEVRVTARSTAFEHEGGTCATLSVPKAIISAHAGLSPAERTVAMRVIEGDSRGDIARQRSTSPQTIACQVRSVFSKFRLTGRNALVARGLEHGWFDDPSLG